MADVHGDPRDVAQMPQADSAGSAPVPYGGARQFTEPGLYDAGMTIAPIDPVADVYHAMPGGNAVQQDAAAAYGMGPMQFGADAPYYPGPLAPVDAHGDPDAGGRDDVAATVQQSMQNSQARWREFEGDNGTTGTPGPGAQPVHAGVIGDLIQFPPGPLDPGAGVGNTLPTAAFFDPPRDYGGDQSITSGHIGNEPPPGFQGEAQ